MQLPGPPTAVIAVVLCGGCFALLVWVWAKALDDPSRPSRPRRRGAGRVQLVVLSLLLLLGQAFATRGLPVQGDPVVLLQLRLGSAVALIAALLLLDQDLRRRADDPRDRHRITGFGVGALGAVLVAAVLSAAEIGIATGDAAFLLIAPGVVVTLGVVAFLGFRLAVLLQGRWQRRRAAKEDAPRDG